MFVPECVCQQMCPWFLNVYVYACSSTHLRVSSCLFSDLLHQSLGVSALHMGSEKWLGLSWPGYYVSSKFAMQLSIYTWTFTCLLCVCSQIRVWQVTSQEPWPSLLYVWHCCKAEVARPCEVVNNSRAGVCLCVYVCVMYVIINMDANAWSQHKHDAHPFTL